MVRFIGGIIVASIILYIWGFVYWGMGNPYYSKEIWKAPNNEATAAAVLSEQFQENGVYFIPSHHQEEGLEGRYNSGPIAFVYMIDADGREMMDPEIMTNGFIINTIYVILLAGLLWSFRSSATTYGKRVCLTCWMGVIAAVFSQIGDVVWWQLDLHWKLYDAGYTVSAFLITGLVLAAFVPKPSGGEEMEPQSTEG